MTVEELMTRDVKTCEPHEPLRAAAVLMRDFDIGCVPVVDPGGALVGILTDRDVCLALLATDDRLSELTVDDAMSRDVRTCTVEDGIDTAERVMQANQVRRLPVVDCEGLLVGILSLSDLARATAHRLHVGVEGLSETALASTLAVISEPIPPPSFVTVGEKLGSRQHIARWFW
jgi:CBS domain-containing protein